MPRNSDQKKSWKSQYLTAKLSRWVVLDTGKIREGEALDPVVYELVPQEMAKGEGDPIGVCKLSDEVEAANTLLDAAIDKTHAKELGYEMFTTLGVGTHKNMSECHRIMSGSHLWPNTSKTEGKQKLLELFGERFDLGGGAGVQVMCDSKRNWRIVIEPVDEK
jgi:hypothetical protein